VKTSNLTIEKLFEGMCVRFLCEFLAEAISHGPSAISRQSRESLQAYNKLRVSKRW
jgi:hypothetical protein